MSSVAAAATTRVFTDIGAMSMSSGEARQSAGLVQLLLAVDEGADEPARPAPRSVRDDALRPPRRNPRSRRAPRGPEEPGGGGGLQVRPSRGTERASGRYIREANRVDGPADCVAVGSDCDRSSSRLSQVSMIAAMRSDDRPSP